MTGVPETSKPPVLPAFTQLPDLASRALAGSVVAANDELFAQRENLIRPEPSVFSAHEFGHKGKVYDGWETRRRRDLTGSDDPDWAIVRLGVPGVVHGVVVDTAWFTGNYPPFVSVEACHVDGYPPAADLTDREWTTIVAKAPAVGDTANAYAVDDRRVWTHLRLSIYPDGGVARFRVHGRPTPDPRFLAGTIDLAALENGGRLVACSDAFYSSPANLILPGRAQIMGHGWENARRRRGGNDFAVFALAGEGLIEHVELDTSYFVGNAPGGMRVQACRAEDTRRRRIARGSGLVGRRAAPADTAGHPSPVPRGIRRCPPRDARAARRLSRRWPCPDACARPAHRRRPGRGQSRVRLRPGGRVGRACRARREPSVERRDAGRCGRACRDHSGEIRRSSCRDRGVESCRETCCAQGVLGIRNCRWPGLGLVV